jgi:predicted  nucleic acid-binding Zn-ribbon protein
MNSKHLLQNLLKLQVLEFDETALDEAAKKQGLKRIAELRLQIPLPILNHYDRLVVRGKKGLAAVQNQTCTGCHVQVTRALVMNLKHGEDIQVCENCGRYLYLAPENEPAAAGVTWPRPKALACAA